MRNVGATPLRRRAGVRGLRVARHGTCGGARRSVMEKMRCRSRSGGWFGRKPLGLVAGAAGMAALGGAYMFGIAPRWLQVVRVRVRLPGLPTAWDGVRIAHLSDMHAGGKGVRDSLLLRARQAALDFEPDIIAITGD